MQSEVDWRKVVEQVEFESMLTKLLDLCILRGIKFTFISALPNQMKV